MNQWHRLGIAGLHAAYRAGEVTPSAVLAAQRRRIAEIDPELHAVLEFDPTVDATESDARVAADALRPLEGMPIAVKSNIAVAGLSWNAGMELRRGIVAKRDAEAVARLRIAGAIVFATLNMHEAALGATTDNVWFGRTGNPHAANTTPGGSSGGSGAAVAAGLCVASLGTDTLGSVRIPAAYTGVYGLKPTAGAISANGLVPLSRKFDTIGPLARSIDDLEAVWTALCGIRPFATPTRLLTLESLGEVLCEPAVLRGYTQATSLLAGLTPARLALASLHEIRIAGFVTVARALSRDLGAQRTSAAEQLSSGLHWLLDYADRATFDPTVMPAAAEAIRSAIGEDGVLLLPTAPQAAFAHGTRAPANQADFTALASIAGLPALSIPAGRDDYGLPVAVQIVGPAGSEAALFALARTLDQGLAGYAPPAGF